jgi:L-lysine 6-oxidase
MRFEIHPAIGVARLGNSPDDFYLEPEMTGGRPIVCNANGEPELHEGKQVPVEKFKDAKGLIKRQASRFRVFVYTDDSSSGREIILGKDVQSIEWTVHIANKKAVWYGFNELEGDLMIPPPSDHVPPLPDNSYKSWGTKLRNASFKGDRRDLIIDPGPRSLSAPGTRAEFSQDSIPPGYKFGRFPSPNPAQGLSITTLGSILLDPNGRLVVLGGFGRAGGNDAITSFAGADSWHDDIADGPVHCKLTLNDGSTCALDAWVIVGSPKFAPELVNIVTLDDILFDVAVRHLKLAPDIYDKLRFPTSGGWNPEYKASFHRDIKPIMDRPAAYQWVANTPTMTSFSSPRFNPEDATEANANARKTYFSYWRKSGTTEVDPKGQENTLATDSGVPMMPLNSGSNSVTNDLIDKFLTLTPTQYFLLGQWAAGQFDLRNGDDIKLDPLDRASVGNAVGSPMCPGIEVTWSLRNPAIYSGPYRIKPAHDETYYAKNGLSTDVDECAGGGCEPGDLTKRMAIPWQSDFFQCTAQYINFTDPNKNKNNDGIPTPQSPMFVMSPTMGEAQQTLAGVPSGFQVYYSRGINTFSEMITAWAYLGFIVNRNTSPSRNDYPSFEEMERNHDKFATSSVAVGPINTIYPGLQSMSVPPLNLTVAVGTVDNVITNSAAYFAPMWFLKSETGPHALTTTVDVALSKAVAKGEEAAKPITSVGIGRMHRGRR